MAKKKINDDEPIEPIHDEEIEEGLELEEEEEEDSGIDEILGRATLGRAAGDLDGWGGEFDEN